MFELLQYISIGIETVIAVLGLLILFQKKKIYGFGIFLTFTIYVFYDFAKLISIKINNNILYASFFIATLSILLAICLIYKESNKKRK